MADSTSWSPWDLVGPAIQAGAGIYGGVASGNAVAGGYNTAAGTIQGALNTSAGALSPYAGTGNRAESALASLYGIGGQAPNFDAFTNSPGYQFQVQQGDQAIQRAANASGNGFSATTLAQLGKYNSGLASTQYQQYLQNLYGLTGLGAGAAANLGDQAIRGAGTLGSAQVGSGLARSAGTNGAMNSLVTAAGKLPWQQIGNYFSNPPSTPGTTGGTNDASGVATLFGFNDPSTSNSDSGTTTYWGDGQ